MNHDKDGRWPAIYDADQLKKQIREIAFSAATPYTIELDDPVVCQGDIVEIAEPVPTPVIDHDGQVVAAGDVIRYWLIIGNTCDFHRSVEDVEWTQVVPVLDWADTQAQTDLEKLQRYELARLFYIPPWPGSDGRHRYANFLQPVPLHKLAITRSMRVVARMRRAGWILLHSALIRFLARDDGRFDANDG